MTRVYIDRTRWLRGQGSGPSRLLRSDGKMCCLGFCLIALGKTEEDIMNVSAPACSERIPFPITGEPSKECPVPGLGTPLIVPGVGPDFRHPYNVGRAMVDNDDETISDTEREASLIYHMKQVGIELVFGDGPEDAVLTVREV